VVVKKATAEVYRIAGQAKEYQVKHQKHQAKCLHLKKQKKSEKRKAWDNQKENQEGSNQLKEENKMDTQDLKVLALNTSAFTVSMTSVEDILKIILLLVSIGFTVQRWYEIHKRNKDNK